MDPAKQTELAPQARAVQGRDETDKACRAGRGRGFPEIVCQGQTRGRVGSKKRKGETYRWYRGRTRSGGGAEQRCRRSEGTTPGG